MLTHEGNHDSISPHSATQSASTHPPAMERDLTSVPTRTGRAVVVAAVVVMVVLIGGFFIVHHLKATDEGNLAQDTAKTAQQPPPVDVVPIENAPSSQPLQLPGETAAWYESTVYARVSGYIREWKVDIGDHVTKGQELCDIETPDLDAELNAAQAKLNVSQANVKIAQADAEFAKTTYDRWWQSPKGVVSDQERQEKKSQFDGSTAKLDATKAQVALDQASVDGLLAQEGFKHVTAPFDGIVTQRKIDIGDLVTAGSTASNTSLYTVTQADKIRTFIDVPQNAATKIIVGRTATVVSDADREHPFVGTVSRTANSINLASRTLRVEVDIPNPSLALMPGMYVEVSFDLKQSGTMQVPASALIFRASGPEVAIVGGDNKVSFRPVVIAQDNGDVVQLSSGAALGDRVALNISSQISDGDVVSPEEVKEPPAPGTPTKTAETLPPPAVAAR
jgi:RND family efflux transporter MFP subunit